MHLKNNERLQELLDRAVDQKKVFGTSFSIMYHGATWEGSAGNMKKNEQYFIASTTKLFVTALVLCFRSQRLLTLEDTIDRYLPPTIVTGLHVIKGYDHSSSITIKNLLAHTSGLPDYFQQKDTEGRSFESSLFSGNDRSWSFEDTLARSKQLKPLFRPGAPNKAHYSDTNFQLLGRILEIRSGKSISALLDELIVGPLGLKNTYLYTDSSDARPKVLYYKASELRIPKAMASFGADGGIVSTSPEMITFLRAFFGGQLFPASYIDELRVWNPIFFPMKSGVGIHRFKLLWLFDPLGTIPELLGHSGLSGALAFHSPEKDLYIAGTVNQVAYPDTSFRLMVKLIQQVIR